MMSAPLLSVKNKTDGQGWMWIYRLQTVSKPTASNR